MGSVGLLYVGAVLFLNGMALLGRVDARAAVPLNLFVGGLQVITPTVLIVTAHGDQATILGASGLYLFGFTYLYVAFNTLAGLDGSGLGWFSLFVAVCAVAYAVDSFVRVGDPASGVIWLMWAFLWTLFSLVLAFGRTGLTRYTGVVAAVEGWVTGAIPAFLLLTGHWTANTGLAAIVLGLVSVLLLVSATFLVRRHSSPGGAAAPPAHAHA